jgi:hypothetical protein
VGLMTDSAVVVLSAMLISPMMGPILSAAFALAIRDKNLLRQSVLAEFRAMFAAWFSGVLLSLVFGTYFNLNFEYPTQEMDGRGTAHGLVGGTVLAIASGVVIGTAITSTGVNSLVGVAISASLLPPVVNSGIFFILYFLPCDNCDRHENFMWYSMFSLLLYVVNFIVIMCVAWGMFILQRVGHIGGILSSNNSHLLNMHNPQVLQKLKLAVGLSKWDDIQYKPDEATHTNFSSKHKAHSSTETTADGDGKESRPRSGSESVQSSRDGAPSPIPGTPDKTETARKYNPARKELANYSCFRPFDEPVGVDTPEFVSGKLAISLYTAARRWWGLAPMLSKEEQATKQKQKDAEEAAEKEKKEKEEKKELEKKTLDDKAEKERLTSEKAIKLAAEIEAREAEKMEKGKKEEEVRQKRLKEEKKAKEKDLADKAEKAWLEKEAFSLQGSNPEKALSMSSIDAELAIKSDSATSSEAGSARGSPDSTSSKSSIFSMLAGKKSDKEKEGEKGESAEAVFLKEL